MDFVRVSLRMSWRLLVVIFGMGVWSGFGASLKAEGWPMWRYDASRSAASPNTIPVDLKLHWTRELGPRKQAWDDPLNLDLMTFDRLFEPIVKDGRMYVGFNDRDKVVAYDLATGEERWTFFTRGPVRFPAVAWRDQLLFASDDGCLYCVDSADGKLNWSFRGGPSTRQILGNQRLVSAWPMRGGPVVRDDRVYFAASIWPFMGTFIYALDAQTGKILWVNDETGAQYIKQPHGAPSFAGVAPQGSLVATQDVLLVPGGRSVPAAFDRHTGKLLYFELNAGGKGTGGSFVAANEESWFVHTRLRGTREFSLKDGVKTAFMPNEPVLAGDRIYAATETKDQPTIHAYDAHSKELKWEVPVDGRGDLILAGDLLFAAGQPTNPEGQGQVSQLTAVRLPIADGEPAIVWQTQAPGTIERLVAADGKLIAVTLEGQIHVFGSDASTDDPTSPRPEARISRSEPALRETPVPLEPEAAPSAIATRLMESGAAEGYAMWLGADDEALVTAVAAQSRFVELAIVEQDRETVARLRRRFDRAGIYGRVTVHDLTRSELMPPPYFANMIFVSPNWTDAAISVQGLVERWYESVRPYGGVLYLLTSPEKIELIRDQVARRNLENAQVASSDLGVVVRRVGPLPGAGTWTHQYGDVANSIKSEDRRVKLPLGVLWFGGNSHNDVLPRHGHGPPEQVVGGRLFIQGVNSLTARDVYTGRVLWKREFKNLGTHDVYFDDSYQEKPLDPAYNQVHIPGANARGTNYVVTDDRIYLVEGSVCHVLDPANGKTLLDIGLPVTDPEQSVEWGYIGVAEDILVGGLGFAKYRNRHGLDSGFDSLLGKKAAAFGIKTLDRAASLSLVGFDRHTGKQLWKVDARHSFWHNGIAIGNGRIFALDRNPKPVEDFLQRRGLSKPDTYRIVSFDLRNGQTAWELPGQVFGSWLSYSQSQDLLLQAGASASDRLLWEIGQGMAVYRGKTGEVVWKKEDLRYSGPCVLYHDLIITNTNANAQSAGAFRLSDGSQKMIANSITGELQPWRITRAYGCNSIIASENLLTFRSGAAGFYDLLTEGGTGNLGGFRSGCTSNLVVADGVLNAPDYTRTCSCSYQNQTSLALVHMPELDAWTVNNHDSIPATGGRIQRLGINLGAPGDRRDAQGLMWLEYPAQAGDAPDLGLTIEGEAQFFQDHPSSLPDAALPWVASSGLEGLTSLRINLIAKPAAAAKSPAAARTPPEPCSTASEATGEPYRIRLHFGLPRTALNEAREFQVSIAEQTEPTTIQLGGAAGYARVITFDRVLLDDQLELRFSAKVGRPVISGIEIERLGE